MGTICDSIQAIDSKFHDLLSSNIFSLKSYVFTHKLLTFVFGIFMVLPRVVWDDPLIATFCRDAPRHNFKLNYGNFKANSKEIS
jgi:hypothetical protein